MVKLMLMMLFFCLLSPAMAGGKQRNLEFAHIHQQLQHVVESGVMHNKTSGFLLPTNLLIQMMAKHNEFGVDELQVFVLEINEYRTCYFHNNAQYWANFEDMFVDNEVGEIPWRTKAQKEEAKRKAASFENDLARMRRKEDHRKRREAEKAAAIREQQRKEKRNKRDKERRLRRNQSAASDAADYEALAAAEEVDEAHARQLHMLEERLAKQARLLEKNREKVSSSRKKKTSLLAAHRAPWYLQQNQKKTNLRPVS
jgi:hypothetical protein